MEEQKTDNLSPDLNYVEEVRQSIQQFDEDKDKLEAYACLNRNVYFASNCEEQQAELERLGWHYLEIGNISAAFNLFYGLYKAYSPKIPPSVIDGLITFYERYNDPAAALLNCETLEIALRREGLDVQIPALHERIKRNYLHLSVKAVHYENTGEPRLAFNSFRAMLEYSPTLDMKAYHGYLRNSIPSGKPEEAYKEIHKNDDYRRVILGNAELAMMYASLVKFVESREEPSVERLEI